ncbi:protein kinase C delta type-like [Hyla sarda]|uniref:protein kinase C delta type-like n=1 Tax=Hyla sarda TaxID=327740 RepID=UPI0024C225BD|nr:protein kinase C delta type-like [Hyla sarda]
MDSTSMKDDGPGPIKKAKVSSLIEKDLNDENILKTPKAEQPRKSLLPLTVDKFTFHHSLGQGYFGKVMFATDCVRREHVAIKSVEKRVLLHVSNGLVEREVLELAQENIFLVHRYGAFHTQNYTYYVMELVGGGTLHEYLTKVPSPTLGIVKFIGAELVCGLQFIHSKGIIHRDLKTENILLTSRGHIKIADFGLALDNVFGRTPGRDIMSTLGLAAPEMILGQPYGCGVD